RFDTDDTGRQLLEKRQHITTLQLPTHHYLAGSVNTVHLKHRLRDVEADRRNRLHSWLLRIVGALAAPTSMALACRWRSRPQHQLRTQAAKGTCSGRDVRFIARPPH